MSLFIATRNEAAEIRFPGLVSSSTGEYLPSPQFVAGEVLVAVGDADFVNVTNLPSQFHSSRFFDATLTDAEMDGELITIKFESSSGEWLPFDFQIVTGATLDNAFEEISKIPRSSTPLVAGAPFNRSATLNAVGDIDETIS